jgi:hypothetical protein
MAYAPRRRGGIAKEVQNFATAFAQGMKLFSDDDRRGRSRANDPYSDENLAKRDERLGSTSALGKLFGRGENELTGFDRGRAVLDEKMRIAAERGDASTYQKLAAESVLLEKQAANPAVGEKWNTPPVPAKGEAPTRPAVPATPPARAATPPAQPPATPPATPATPPATPATPPATPDGSGRPLVTLQSDKGDTEAVIQSPVVEKPVTESAVYEYDPSKGSIFDSGSNAVDYDMGVDLARGGAVPTMYAARGASVTNPTGETGGALSMNDVTNRGAFYTGDNEYGAVQGPPEEGEEPGTPTMYKPEGPAIEDGEPAGRTANLNLPRDPEELAKAAAPAIAAGMDRIQAELKPSGAISAEDPAYQEKLQKFARGEGRMSEEEIKQLDSVIDPDGKLAPSARSAARIAAIYKFYQDKGEPDTARDVAARVILYDKFASQTRGAMALQALKDGDIESGVKLLEDAYNYNMPDAKTARADRDDTGKVVVNDDGTINFNLGWDKLTGFQPTQQGRAGKQDLIQLASNTARGTEQTQRLMMASGKKAATGAVANKSTDEEVTKSLEAVRSAAIALRDARNANDPEAVAQASRELEAARGAIAQLPVPKMRDGRSDENVRTRRIKQATDAAISIIGTTGRTTSGTGGGTKEERTAAAEATRLQQLDRAERALIDAMPTTRVLDETQTEDRARVLKGLQEIALERASIAADKAPATTASSEKPAARAKVIDEAIDTFLEEGKPEVASGKIDPKTLPKLEGNTRRAFRDIADKVLMTNNMQPDTAVRALYDATHRMNVKPQLITDGKGGAILAVGSERLVVDRDTYRRIAEMRGMNRSAALKGETAAANAEALKYQEGVRKTAERRFDIDDKEQQLREQGLLERAIGGTNYVPAARPTPRKVLNEAARERWRQFNRQNRPSSE